MQLTLVQGGVAVGLYFLLTLVFKVRALLLKLHSPAFCSIARLLLPPAMPISQYAAFLLFARANARSTGLSLTPAFFADHLKSASAEQRRYPRATPSTR